MVIENLEIEITEKASTTYKNLDTLEASLKNLKTTSAGFTGKNFVKLASNLDVLNNSIRAFSASKLKKISDSLKAMDGVKVSLKNASSEMSAKAAITTPATDYGSAIAPARTTSERYSEIASAASQVSVKTADMNKSVSQATVQMRASAAAATDLKKRLDETGESAESGAGKFSKLFASLKRVAMYRAIRSALRMITQAFKEGLDNAYEYSKLTGGPLAASMDKLSASLKEMKTQLGAALGELLQTLAPVLELLIGLVTILAKGLAKLFAFLGGRRAEAMSAPWEKADEAAKSFKSTILGFDELNVIEPPGGSAGEAWSEYYGGDVGKVDLPDIPVLPPFKFNGWQDFLKQFEEVFAQQHEWQALKNLFDALAAWPGILGSLTGILGGVIKGLRDMGDASKGATPGVVDGLNDVGTALDGLKQKQNDFLVDQIPFYTTFEDGVANLTNKLKDIINQTALSVSERLKRSQKDTTDILNGTGKSALDSVNTAKEGILENISQLVLQSLGIIVPWSVLSKKTIADVGTSGQMSIGEFVTGSLGAILGWGVLTTKYFAEAGNLQQAIIDGSFSGMGDSILDWVNSTPTPIAHWGDYIIDLLKRWGNNAVNVVQNTVTEIKRSVSSLTGETVSDSFSSADIGSGIGQLFADVATFGWASEKNKLKTEGAKAFELGAGFAAGSAMAGSTTLREAISSGNFWLMKPKNNNTSSKPANKSIFGAAWDYLTDTSYGNLYEEAFGANPASSGLEGLFRDIGNGAKEAWGWLKEAGKWLANTTTDGLAGAGAAATGGFAALGELMKMLPLLGFASGGFPTTGQLFLARENGPEMVGAIGGRTAVANNQDIVAAIASGVYDAMIAAATQGGGAGGTTTFIAYLDGQQVKTAVKKAEYESGAKIATGGLLYA